jgi:hypothetical protein
MIKGIIRAGLLETRGPDQRRLRHPELGKGFELPEVYPRTSMAVASGRCASNAALNGQFIPAVPLEEGTSERSGCPCGAGMHCHIPARNRMNRSPGTMLSPTPPAMTTARGGQDSPPTSIRGRKPPTVVMVVETEWRVARVSSPPIA